MQFGRPVTAGSVELEILRPEGNVLVADMRVVESEWDGECVFIVSLRDITERKQADIELRDACTVIEKLKNQLAAESAQWLKES